MPTIGAAKNLLHVGGLVQREVRAELHAAQHAQQAQQAQHAQQGDAAAALGEDSSGQERQSEPAGEEDAGGPAQPLAAEAAVAAAAAAAAAAGGAAPVPAPGAAPLVLRASGGEVLGAAVLPAGCSRPIYVSVGHRLSLGTAVEITLRCCRHRCGREHGKVQCFAPSLHLNVLLCWVRTSWLCRIRERGGIEGRGRGTYARDGGC